MGADVKRFEDRATRTDGDGDGIGETRILLVGHFGGTISDDIRARFSADMQVIDFSALTAQVLADFAPHFVVSPVLTRGFDVLDLAQKLWHLRYSGAYRALAEGDLPDTALIVREVRLACPGLDVDLLSVTLRRGPAS